MSGKEFKHPTRYVDDFKANAHLLHRKNKCMAMQIRTMYHQTS